MITRVNSFTIDLTHVLNNYASNVRDALRKDIRATAVECGRDIKANAPKRSGDYAESWRAKISGDNIKPTATVYAVKPGIQLAHLLEFGHGIKDSHGIKIGEAKPINHITQAADRAAINLETRVTNTLQKLT